MLGYESHEERFNLRSREFNIIYESVARREISHGAFYGVFIQVCSFNLRDVKDFGIFLFYFVTFMSMCNEQFLSTSPLIQLREVLEFSRRQKVQHNLACGPLILLYITIQFTLGIPIQPMRGWTKLFSFPARYSRSTFSLVFTYIDYRSLIV